MRCQYVKPNGERCQMQAISNTNCCFSHNPDTADQKREAIMKGGFAPKKHLPNLAPIQLQNIDDAKILLAETINQVRGGIIDVKVANCIGFLINHFVKASELSDLQKRIEIIERALHSK